MEANRSLEMSTKIREQLQRDLSVPFYDYFPFEISNRYKTKSKRDRLYSQENTFLTMLLTMTNEDKSLQQSVNIYKKIHEKNMEKIIEEKQRIIKESEQEDKKRKRGRRVTTGGRIAKSKQKEISSNTSAYTQARQRIDYEYMKEVYEHSRNIQPAQESLSRWKGLNVYISDGTYLQMQDTPAIRQEFPPSQENTYPKGLLEVVIEQGSGIVYEFELSNNKKSELEIISGMIDKIPANSLLLADDLYNCFTIFSQLKQKNIEFIVPGKRKRKYSVFKNLGEGDDLVYIFKTETSKWYRDKAELEKELLVRRIEYDDPNDSQVKWVLYTSLTDSRISKLDIVLKYSTRWDIEVGIKEIKTIMDIGIVRSKNPEMVRKEVTAAMIAYNYLRSFIMEIAVQNGFSPQRDIIQKFYQDIKPVLVDKLGRKYSRWSPGRYSESKGRSIKVQSSEETW